MRLPYGSRHNDTIFALSSARGRAGVAVFRISGPECRRAFELLGLPDLPARKAVRVHPQDYESGMALDDGLALWFPGPNSFTGEDSLELHLHGSRAIEARLVALLSRIESFRPAEPGEFTLRALEHGKLDLAQAEALADLIDSDTEQQRRQALRGLEGEAARRVANWRSDILEIRALIAADIDFSDEGDVGDVPLTVIDSALERLYASVVSVLASAERGRMINDGFHVVIAGRPNVGKSTLLNHLAGTDAALVTDIAGTTRDIIEVRLDLDGYLVVLRDTAGLRDTDDVVEKLGIARARTAMSQADLVLHLSDDNHWDAPDESVKCQTIRVRTKSDRELVSEAETSAIAQSDEVLTISCVTGEGITALKDRIVSFINAQPQHESLVLTSERQRRALQSALASIGYARESLPLGVEFADQALQDAQSALSHLIGLAGVEDVLGEVFSRFCVGK